MATRYRIDPGKSRFTAQAFATGFLSFLGHSPTFAVRDFAGEFTFEDDTIRSLRVAITVKADSLQVLDKVSASDRREIEGKMRTEVLETAVYPEITFQASVATATVLGQGRHQLRLDGRLSLHGVTQPYQVDAELVVFDDGVRLRGEAPLRMSDFRIKPVTALAGTLKLKDEMKISFDLAAVPEGS